MNLSFAFVFIILHLIGLVKRKKDVLVVNENLSRLVWHSLALPWNSKILTGFDLKLNVELN